MKTTLELVKPYTIWRFDCGVVALVYDIERAVSGINFDIVKVLFGDNNFGLVYLKDFRQATLIG